MPTGRFAIAADTAANWTSVNPVLATGEKGRESDTKLEKTGDGSTAWNSLRYDNMRAAPFFVDVTANGTYELALWPAAPLTLTRVKFRTKAGTCTVQIVRNGTAINGFGSAQNATTTPANVSPSGINLAENDVIAVTVASASSLTGLFVTFEARV